jgi:Type II secretion system (T2SS), protein N
VKYLRYVIVAGLLIGGFSIWLAPASLLRRVTNEVPGLDIVNTTGSLWHGRGTIVLQGEGVGALNWRLKPARLLALELGYDFSFTGRDTSLQGVFTAGIGRLGLTGNGLLGNQSLNYTLAPYGVTVSGDILVDHVKSVWRRGTMESLDGLLGWNGGPVSWSSATPGSANLPGMQARLEGAAGTLNGVIIPANGQTPVIQGSLLADGTLQVGMTMLLFRLLGIPWQGSEPDHVIVMEMTEDVF